MDQVSGTYHRLLLEFIEQGGEVTLVEAADLGRRLMGADVPPEEVLAVHQEAVEKIAAERPLASLADLASVTAQPLFEMLMAYGIAFREQIARREQRQRADLEAVTEQSADMVMITDHLGIVEYVNPAFLAVTGYERQECIGSTPADLLGSGQTPRETYDDLWRTIASGQVWRGRLIDRKKDGSLFVADQHVFPLRSGGQGRVQYVTVVRDATERVELERALQEQTQRLVTVATMSAGLTHDLNNLLGAVLGYADLLGADLNDPQAVANLEQIRIAARRGRDLVEGTLGFARAGSGGARVPVPVGASACEVADLLRPSAGPMVSVEVVDHAEGALVSALPGHVDEIMLNLGLNAIHALAGGRGTVRITLTRVQEVPPEVPTTVADCRTGYVVIEVSDDGPGIAAEDAPSVFEAFYTSRADEGGTGLGLAMVRRVAERLGGGAVLAADASPGATFRVYLPRFEPPEDNADAALDAEPAVEGTDVLRSGHVRRNGGPGLLPSSGSRAVLVVDDEPAQVALLTRELTQRGWEVVGCTSPWDALNVVRCDPELIGIVVSDVHMPEMDGYELADRLRRLQPGIPVVLTTYNTQLLDPERLTELGIKSVHRLPIVMAGLVAHLDELWSEQDVS